MDDHVVAVVGRGSTLYGVVPRQDHLALCPRLSEQGLALLLLHAAVVLHAVHHKSGGVHEDLAQLGVTGAPVQREQTGLRSNGDAHLVGDFQPGTADERFLGDEDLDFFLQLQLQVGRHLPEVRHPLAQDLAPRCGERLLAQLPAAQQGTQGPGQQRQNKRRRQRGEDQGVQNGRPVVRGGVVQLGARHPLSSRLSRQGHHHGGFVYLDPGLLPVHHACSRRRKTDQLQATSQLHSDLIAAFVRGQVGDRP